MATKSKRIKTSTRKNQHVAVNYRREGALKRLEVQLKSGQKTAKKSFDKIPLTDSDKKRIKNQITILKDKINHNRD